MVAIKAASQTKAGSPMKGRQSMMRRRYAAAVALVGALLAGCVVIATPAVAEGDVVRVDVPGQPTVIFGTLQNLPPLDAQSLYMAGPGFAPVIEAYRASGQYTADQRAVAAAARRYLDRYLSTRCQGTRCGGKRPAAVFDIDDTLLSSYPLYAANGFAPTSDQVDAAQAGCQQPVIDAVKEFYDRAKSRKVALFLITGRRSQVREQTQQCLAQAGITGWVELIMREPNEYNLTAEQYKSAHRAQIQGRGYVIITSIGDQASDSTGGSTLRGFLLPNPMYFIP